MSILVEKVFKTEGVPEYTFVKPHTEVIDFLTHLLRHMRGRLIVI
jgi:hypothetical protein